jgi:hypothetical protein
MKNLEWLPYYNEYSRIQGQEAKGKSCLFRILPSEYGFSLTIFDAYTGVAEGLLPFRSQEDAAAVAIKINYKTEIGVSLPELLKDTKHLNHY